MAAHGAAEVLWRLQRRGRDVGLIRLTRDEQLDLNSDFFVGMARRHRVLFIQDWFFRNQENVARNADVLRDYFTPHATQAERARAAVEPARAAGRLVVGVHIRRGDYERFKEGRFFFSHDTYRQAMEQTQAAHPDAMSASWSAPTSPAAGRLRRAGADRRARARAGGPLRPGIVRPPDRAAQHLQQVGLVLGRGAAVADPRAGPATRARAVPRGRGLQWEPIETASRA